MRAATKGIVAVPDVVSEPVNYFFSKKISDRSPALRKNYVKILS
jgi:hypothetical protein